MVWAISQDTSEGKFSKQLQQAIGYKSRAVITFNTTVALGGGVFKEVTESEANGDVSSSQCRWTNCGQTCPSKWLEVKREDPYRKSSKELMLDATGCGGNGVRTFCCPPGKQPFCQWLFHNNGKCSPGCPDRNGEEPMYEVASTSAACNNGKAQVACCRGNTPALDVYRQYKWYGKEHDCAIDVGSKQCGWSPTFNMPLTSSWDGSGAQVCKDSKGKRGTRPLCGDESDPSKPHFTNCEWVDKFNLGLTDIADRSECNGNCPSGKVKVALQVQENMCRKGTLAYCCDVQASFSSGDLDDIDQDDVEALLKAWVKKPTCPNIDVSELSSRSTDTNPSSVREQLASLVRRGAPMSSAVAVQLTMQRIMEHPPNSPLTKKDREMFDRAFSPRWPHVAAAYMAATWNPLKDVMSMALPTVNSMCHMNEEEKAAEDAGTGVGIDEQLICLWKDLEAVDPGLLQDPEDVDSDVEGPTIEDLEEALGEWNWPVRWGIKPRGTGGARPVSATCPDKSKVKFKTEEYINGDNGDALANANQDFSRYGMKDSGDCFDDAVDGNGDKDDDEWVSEHILELQAFRNFIEYSMDVQHSIRRRTTPSGITIKPLFNPSTDNLATCSMWKKDFLDGFKKWTDAGNTETPKKQLYSLLGSKGHSSHMVNCGAKLNSMKARFWKFSDPMSKTKWEAHCSQAKKSHLERAFSEFKLIAGVWNYLNNEDIQDKLVATHKDIAKWLVKFEDLYLKEHPTAKRMHLGDIQWHDFMTEYFQAMLRFSTDWTNMRLKNLRKLWSDRLLQLNRQYQQAASGSRLAAQIQTQSSCSVPHNSRTHQHDTTCVFTTRMDPNLELYRSILHLDITERRQRMQHLPTSECVRVRKIVEREQSAQKLQEKLAGRDLVEMALSDPSEFKDSPLLQNALLGRALTFPDECTMVARVAGKGWFTGEALLSSVACYDQNHEPEIPIDAWKLVYCDLYYIDGSNATLQDIYEERLREEELQTPAAQAREIIRRDVIKLARRNAKWMISGLEQLPDKERVQESWQYKEILHTIWKRVSPAPPAWIQHILDANEEWGFVYYRSREVQRKYGHDWASWWARVLDSQLPDTERNIGDATIFSIHCQGNRSDLMYLSTEDWPTFQANNNLAEDDDFRKQFKKYIQNKGDLLPAGISRSTFIVIPTELIPDSPEWDEDDELDPYWVWAYDADWDSSEEETTFEGETYQGRVKVAYYSLKSWFYGARWEGVSLRDMWLKAQQHPDRLWICYTKHMEERDHEPYI
ncbi:uncharacterized protein NECHADRAFT_88725 [Fusarium vanettenii 77-13-4]|uniref:Uncharacterized protein n=1 Tax=Fusarium vanettenii (strain ATCC MYA-4622 / CBS 123669 / FGSC 9596 / NRRL 45880 / 77-13-4) TaxID=660122 RepID=C7ZC38_FUSV7|nr:uncharacterized protein NECHADRAFT_88725 [Fusarium vanettenii 77-13-4]EEU38421.1 hypothetical protein NECHADRAFT_88725 [Fusarium vanettenii 77-13-4]